MKNRTSVNINGSISGIVNFGNNTININETKENNVFQLDNNKEESDMNRKHNFKDLKKEKMSSNIVKTISEIIIGVIISVIAGYILYKLNMN